VSGVVDNSMTVAMKNGYLNRNNIHSCSLSYRRLYLRLPLELYISIHTH